MTDTTNLEAEEVLEPDAVDGVDEDQTDLNDDQAEDEADGDEEGSQEEDEEYEEVERGDKKYKVPKALKDDLLRHDDYTRKTQSVAEERRALEAERKSFDAAKVEIEDKAFELKAIDRRMKELSDLTHDDWAQLRQINPEAYDRLNREFQTLPRQKENLAAELKAKTDEVLKAQHEDRAKRTKEGQDVLARDIKGWGPELGAKLIDFVQKDFGIQAGELDEILMDPRAVKLIHAAYEAKGQAQKVRTQATAEKVSKIKPVGGVKGSSVPKTGLSDELSTAEWMKREREQSLARKTGSARR